MQAHGSVLILTGVSCLPNRVPWTTLQSNQRTTQERLILLTLFILIVNTIVQNWLALMVEDQLVPDEGLGILVGRCLGLFYADNLMVG